ncbi:MAG: regulatory iron-sulfur-containing complex subunit RicT [Bacilli bacterium]
MITLLGIPFDFAGMTYYQTKKDVALGDMVVCPTEHGTFIGVVKKLRVLTEEETQRPNFSTLYPSINRIATFQDKSFFEESDSREKKITRETQNQADLLKLDMKVLNSHLDIDEDKVLITFSAEQRVDFRELVRILNGSFHLRIELRQIGPRDQAKTIGGIGPCGLPLCCSTFLNSFDGISIAMAKNQLLAINIPKLSGQCGKLMCCLKFEDKAYSLVRPLYPKIGEKFTYKNSTYSVSGLNLLNDTITAYNGDNYESFSKEEYERVKNGLEKQTAPTLKADINAGIDLSGHGLKETNRRISQINQTEEKHKEDIISKTSRTPVNNNQNRNNNNNQNRNNNRNNNNPNRSTQPNNSNNQNRNNKNYQNKNSYQNNTSSTNSTNNRHNNSFNNNRNGNSFNRKNPTNAPKPANSGFIPVSQISDKSVLDVKPVNKDAKK